MARRDVAAFTLIEVLVVIAIIAILAGLAFPVFAAVRASADGSHCASNLQQIGCGINAYMNDNNDTFPGPLWGGQTPWFTGPGDGSSLPSLLQNYLNLQPQQSIAQRSDVFVCPAYNRVVTVASAPDYVMPPLPNKVRPWGYPSGNPNVSPSAPMTRNALGAVVDTSGNPLILSQTVAMRDVDQMDFQGGSEPGWYNEIAPTPVHGNYENALFFDWHVGRIDAVTHLPR